MTFPAPLLEVGLGEEPDELEPSLPLPLPLSLPLPLPLPLPDPDPEPEPEPEPEPVEPKPPLVLLFPERGVTVAVPFPRVPVPRISVLVAFAGPV